MLNSDPFSGLIHFPGSVCAHEPPIELAQVWIGLLGSQGLTLGQGNERFLTPRKQSEAETPQWDAVEPVWGVTVD